MVISKAVGVEEYLSEQAEDRRTEIEKVRHLILKNLPDGFQEEMQYGMICYVVPFSEYPKGYLDNPKMPLCYIGLASQKNHISLYLMNQLNDGKKERWFSPEFLESGKKLDLGKGCLRFKKYDDIAEEVIAETINKTSVTEFIKMYEEGRFIRKKNDE